MPEGPTWYRCVKHDNLPAENPQNTLSWMEPVWKMITSSCICETLTSPVAYATQRGHLPLAGDFAYLWVSSSHTCSSSMSPKMPSQAVSPLQLQRSAISWLIPTINQNATTLISCRSNTWFHLACCSHQIFRCCNRKVFEYLINFNMEIYSQSENSLEWKLGLLPNDDFFSQDHQLLPQEEGSFFSTVHFI